ncbi:hypothetical protein SFRURICE_001775 [Spodoptera frugiperda]|nr:hypothetical protein SFRURICE_001775 [Spodoptera frugiperda]
MSLIFRRLARNNPRNIVTDAQILIISSRKLSLVPSLYDDQDPAPKFFSSNVQILLKRLTRPDFNKVFRKRTNHGFSVLKTPSYKFLTNEELDGRGIFSGAAKIVNWLFITKYLYHFSTFFFFLVRSTRHFGPMTFYLTWHKSMDNLMLELIQGGAVREAVLLSALRQDIHGDVANGDVARTLAQQILPTPVQLTKPETLTEEDIQLDSKCVECIEKYITGTSSMKSQQELALQGFREYYQQLIDLSRGLKKAHGKQ